MLVLIWHAFNTDIETNECLTDNGGCWQDKANNVTACKVPQKDHFLDMPYPVAYFNHVLSSRILFVAEFVNVPYLTECNLREMVTTVVKVIFPTLHILIMLDVDI